MVRLLKPPLEIVHHVEVVAGMAVVLADCHPAATNHLLSGELAQPVAVIDHHSLEDRSPKLRFQDIRPRLASSAAIAVSYLKEQRVEPGHPLATALLYAIKTETAGRGTMFSHADRQAVSWLTARADPAQLADIENAPLSRAYFGDLLLALERTLLYGNVAFCDLPKAIGPEIVGEIADLLIRCEAIDRVLCSTTLNGDLLLSARTTKGHGNAADLLARALNGIGHCGGHAHRAGGKIVEGDAGMADDELVEKVRRRWLSACEAESNSPSRLVSRKAILDHL
jgi:nanoRNase/pAp phosphatase (c-di-AMP/oligoRNAs hydrolase)